MKLLCEYCGKEYSVYPSRATSSRFCSKSCQGKYQSKMNDLGKVNHTAWNKGLKADTDERVLLNVKKGSKTYRDKIERGYIPKHRGKPLSNERKEIISKSHADMSGRNNPMFGRVGKSAPNYGGHVKGSSYKREHLSHRVRSRWEANFATVLLYEQKDYQYEPKAFDLSNGMTYTPDFWVEDEKCWYEIKGCWTEYSLNKFNKFREEYPNEKIIVCEKDMYFRLYEEYKDKITWEFDREGRV